MDGFFRAKNKGELTLVFNIGSSFVGGDFFLAQKSGIPRIIFSVKELIPIKEEIDIKEFLFLTVQTLQIVIDKIYKAKIGVPEQIFCILSSPWYSSQVRVITLEKNTPFVFNAKLAENLIQREINFFKEEYSVKKTDKDDLFRIIEFKNIKTTLNGYETPKPLNQKAKELEMAVFVSMGEEKILKKIEEVIKKYFDFKKIVFSSSSLASFAVVRDMYKEDENFLLLDVDGEMTDIFMTKKGALSESATFPLGVNFFIRGIASFFNCTIDEASSLLSLVEHEHAEKKLVKKLLPILDQLKTNWLKQLENSLANLSNDISIPSTVFLITDSKMVNLFSEIIKAEQFNQHSATESKFKIIPLDNQILHEIAQFKENVNREPVSIINAVYVNRLLKRL